MIPFKILAAALSTLAIIIGKLSEELEYQKNIHDSPYWKIAFSVIYGVSAYLWVSSLFRSTTGIVLGTIACVICVIYKVNKMEFAITEATDNLSAVPDFLNKEGKINTIIDENQQKDGDVTCIGELFESKETVLVHLCGDVKEGDTFRITQINGGKIYGTISKWSDK